MSELALNKEILAALENCKDAKEVMALAKSRGVDLNEEQANKVFASTHKEELTDEEMDMIVGGCYGASTTRPISQKDNDLLHCSDLDVCGNDASCPCYSTNLYY